MLYAIYYMLNTIYYILYTIYHILYTIYDILYTIYYILYTIYCLLYSIYYIIYSLYYIGPAPSSRGNLAHARARGAGSPHTIRTMLLALIGDYTTEWQWHWNREGGRGGKWRGLETSKHSAGRPDPAGQGRAERPRKYSPVTRENRGTSTVVRGKWEGGGGGRKERRAPQDSRENLSVDEGTLSQAKPTRRVEGLKTIAGGVVSFAPPHTPKPSTTSRISPVGCKPAYGMLGKENRRRHLSAEAGGLVAFRRTDHGGRTMWGIETEGVCWIDRNGGRGGR